MEVPVEKLFEIIEQKYKENKNKKSKDKKYNQLVLEVQHPNKRRSRKTKRENAEAKSSVKKSQAKIPERNQFPDQKVHRVLTIVPEN